MTLPWSDPNADPLADIRAVWEGAAAAPYGRSSDEQLRAAIDRAAQQYADLNGFPADTVSTPAGEVPLDRLIEPHVCDYAAGRCRLPGVHGGVPDPDPAEAQVEDSEAPVDSVGELSLRCAHYARGCWWAADAPDGKLGVLLAAAREHLASAHRLTIDATVVTSARALTGNVVPTP